VTQFELSTNYPACHHMFVPENGHKGSDLARYLETKSGFYLEERFCTFPDL
jgi:hypothetical protein